MQDLDKICNEFERFGKFLLVDDNGAPTWKFLSWVLSSTRVYESCTLVFVCTDCSTRFLDFKGKILYVVQDSLFELLSSESMHVSPSRFAEMTLDGLRVYLGIQGRVFFIVNNISFLAQDIPKKFIESFSQPECSDKLCAIWADSLNQKCEISFLQALYEDLFENIVEIYPSRRKMCDLSPETNFAAVIRKIYPLHGNIDRAYFYSKAKQVSVLRFSKSGNIVSGERKVPLSSLKGVEPHLPNNVSNPAQGLNFNPKSSLKDIENRTDLPYTRAQNSQGDSVLLECEANVLSDPDSDLEI